MDRGQMLMFEELPVLVSTHEGLNKLVCACKARVIFGIDTLEIEQLVALRMRLHFV